MERIHTNDTQVSGERNVIFRNCLYAGPLTLERSQGNIFAGNAMYGTNQSLRNRTMPFAAGTANNGGAAIATSAPRQYLGGGAVFDGDGVYLIDVPGTVPNQNNRLWGNWYQGARPAGQDAQMPDSYYNATQRPLLSNPSNQATQSCVNNATNRANDLVTAAAGR